MVRTAESARSSAAVMAPTASCACRDARRIPRETLIATAMPRPTARTVTSSSQTSTTAIAIRAPTAIATDPAISTTPEVTVARRNVVSAPTRDIRSPVRRRSYSATGSRSKRSASVLRVLRTTPSAVRWSTYCCAAPRNAPATSTTTSAATAGSSERPAPTAPMTRATRTGWARAAAAPTRESPAASPNAARCGRSRGSSSRGPADAGEEGAVRPSHSRSSVRGPLASVAGGERADDRGQQPGVVLDQLGAVPVGPDGGDVSGARPELVPVVGPEQQPLEGRVLGQAAHLRPVLRGQQLPAHVERLVAAGHRQQPAGAVLPEPGRGQPERRDGAQQRSRGDRVLGHPLPAPWVHHVERDELHGARPAAQHPGGPRLLARAHRSGLQQGGQGGVLGAAAVGDRPPVLQRPALRAQLVALVGERPLHLRVTGPLAPAEEPTPGAFRGRGRRSGGVDVGLAVPIGSGRGEVPAGRLPGVPIGGVVAVPGSLPAVGDVRLDLVRFPASEMGRLAPLAAVVGIAVARGAHHCIVLSRRSGSRRAPVAAPIRTCRAVPGRGPSAGPSSSWGRSVLQRATGSRRPRPPGRAACRGSRGPAAGAGWPRPWTPPPPGAHPR